MLLLCAGLNGHEITAIKFIQLYTVDEEQDGFFFAALQLLTFYCVNLKAFKSAEACCWLAGWLVRGGRSLLTYSEYRAAAELDERKVGGLVWVLCKCYRACLVLALVTRVFNVVTY